MISGTLFTPFLVLKAHLPQTSVFVESASSWSQEKLSPQRLCSHHVSREESLADFLSGSPGMAALPEPQWWTVTADGEGGGVEDHQRSGG